MKKKWQDMLVFPLRGRTRKPRSVGVTMLLDKGLGLAETRDLVGIAGDYIDIIKLGFGTSALYDDDILREKVDLVRQYQIDIYPGGTFFEIAVLQDKVSYYLRLAREIGFTAIEVSDGTINLAPRLRQAAIEQAANLGFTVLAEVGKKWVNGESPDYRELAEQALRDLAAGARWVIVEGREFGRNVTLFDSEGSLKEHALKEMQKHLGDPDRIIWEAPLKKQQEALVEWFGPNVNLGNIPPREVLALEALRVGLRSDTLRLLCDGK
ncbi:MAG: Phosphosulfolactate synthase [Clostridia bacterium 62_21]|nr:MAG: Phosphosulfolactate synthase [Clostridia bacterium 62_21]